MWRWVARSSAGSAAPDTRVATVPAPGCTGSAVVHELQGHVEVRALEQGDHRLQVVAALARNAQLVTGDLCLDRLRALVTNDLRDLLRVLLREPLLEGRLDPVFLAGGPGLAGVQGLERDTALDELG